jgi:hypothetical protein
MTFSTLVRVVAFLVLTERGEEKHEHAKEPDDAARDRDRDQQR